MTRFNTSDRLLTKLGEAPLVDAQLRADAERHRTEIEADDKVTTEAGFNAAEVIENAKNSLDFLAAIALPTIFKYFFPPVFLTVWEWLKSYAHQTRVFPQLALGLPRGFGKTTVIKLFVLYCILFTKKQFILIISETEGKAKGILSDVCDMLEEPNIKKLFGDWKIGGEIDRQDLKKFGFRGRNIILKAVGAGTGVRGINEKNLRPDIMIFDDVQSREAADSETVSTALEQWLYGTAMKAKSPEGCMFLFIANMYPTKWSILRRLKKNSKWIKFIAGGILNDGTSLWEELQPIEQLLSEFENDLNAGHPEIFYAEVLNDENASANNLIDLSRLPVPPFDWDQMAAGKFIVVDPAAKSGAANDAVTIAYFEVHAELPCCRLVDEDRMSPGESIRRALMMAIKHGVRVVGVEATAYQATYKWWFDYICQQYGIAGIDCVEVYPGFKSKNARILEIMKSYAAGELYIHPDATSICHGQMAGFRPLKRDNTDGVLDCLTYAPKMIELYGPMIEAYTISNTQEWDGIPALEHNSPF
jgi:hypothetical protein